MRTYFMIIGHKKNIDFLDRAVESNRLSHAYCFVGPDQIGKRTVAKYLAAKVLKTEPDKIFKHPDFFYLEREEDEKKGRLKKEISIAQAKTVGNFLQNRSWLGGTRAVIIDEAEKINDEAANALLKTLEESTDKSLIILLTVDEKQLPATVRSRCQIIEFFLVPEQELTAGLLEKNFSPELVEQVSVVAWGRPGKALELLNTEGALGEYLLEVDRFKNIIGQPFHTKLKMVEDLFGDKHDTTRARDHLKEILDLWIIRLREIMVGGKVTPKEAEIASKSVVEIIGELQEAQKMLRENIHPRLLMERILLKL